MNAYACTLCDDRMIFCLACRCGFDACRCLTPSFSPCVQCRPYAHRQHIAKAVQK